MSQANFPGNSQQGSAKLVIVALTLAVLTAAINYIYIQGVRNEVREDFFVVFTLRREIRPGDKLKKGDLEEQRIPTRFRDSFSGAIFASDLDQRIDDDAVFLRPAREGELLTKDLFNDPTIAFLSKLKPAPGFQLISLPVNSNSQPGALMPESRVDIAAAFPIGGSVPKVETVMENVRLRAVGTVTALQLEQAEIADERRPRMGRYKNITIEVRPKDVEILHAISLFAQEGYLLSLRAPEDRKPIKILNPNPDSDINPKVIELIKKAQESIITTSNYPGS